MRIAREMSVGRPVIAGTRLCVADLAACHTVAGLTPEQLAGQFNLEQPELLSVPLLSESPRVARVLRWAITTIMRQG